MGDLNAIILQLNTCSQRPQTLHNTRAQQLGSSEEQTVPEQSSTLLFVRKSIRHFLARLSSLDSTKRCHLQGLAKNNNDNKSLIAGRRFKLLEVSLRRHQRGQG